MRDNSDHKGFTRRQILTGLSALAASTAFPGLAMAEMAKPKQQFLTFGSSSIGGAWFSMAGAISDLITRAYPELRITTEATGGTRDNINLMKAGEIELGLTSNAEAYQAMNGQEPFSSVIDNFSVVMNGGSINWQMYTLDPTIKTIHDLKGKRVSLGAPGSVGNKVGEAVIEAHGLKMGEDWKADYLSHGGGPDALRDGSIDVVLIISAIPTAPIIDITSSHGDEVYFIMPDPEIIEEMKKDAPYMLDVTIPGGTYNGHPDDIPGTFGYATILIASNELSDEAVYAVIKTICENPKKLESAHANGRDWKLETALVGVEGVLPIHPGAEIYLKEQGLL